MSTALFNFVILSAAEGPLIISRNSERSFDSALRAPLRMTALV